MIVGPLFKEHGPKEFWKHLNGMWGIILYDQSTKRFWIGRDQCGIIPLYWGVGAEGEVYVSSELKCFHDQVTEVLHVLPGHYITNECE
jgi:asparagine synthase (glutamine-hydrolysing)